MSGLQQRLLSPGALNVSDEFAESLMSGLQQRLL